MQSSAYPLKFADVKKIIIAAPSFRNRCVIVIKCLFWLGLRPEELTDLDIRDIDFERKRAEEGAADKHGDVRGDDFGLCRQSHFRRYLHCS